MIKFDYRTIITLFCLGILCSSAFAGQKISEKEKDALSDQTATLVLPIQFYRTHISKVAGNRCQMVPSCSTFCIQAIKKHGWLLGWIMCSDRLVRCGRDEEKISPSFWINNEKRIYDPVENNDFWWSQSSVLKAHKQNR